MLKSPRSGDASVTLLLSQHPNAAAPREPRSLRTVTQRLTVRVGVVCMAASYTDQLLREDYVNHEHMRAYARALSSGDAQLAADESSGAQRISAAPDFAPIHETAQHRVQTSKPRSIDRGGVPEGFVYGLLRWPLLCVLFTLITLDFWLYVETRQLVNAIESLWTWRGRSRALRRRLRRASTYAEWKRAALELDAYHQHDTWKLQDASALYDWQFVNRVVGRLQGMSTTAHVTMLTEQWHARKVIWMRC